MAERQRRQPARTCRQDQPRRRHRRITTLKHYEITSYYSKPNKTFGGLTPREYLADKSIEERFRVGVEALIEAGVLKP